MSAFNDLFKAEALTDPEIKFFMYSYGMVIGSGLPKPVFKLLASSKWVGNSGELARRIIKLQLGLYEESLKPQSQIRLQDDDDEKNEANAETTPKRIPTLFDAVTQKLSSLFEEDQDSIETLLKMSSPCLARAAWLLHAIPYTTFCTLAAVGGKGKETGEATNESAELAYEKSMEKDVDLWILRNEEWLRRRNRTRPQDDWRTGLITFDTIQSVLPSSGHGVEYRKIVRPQKMEGFCFLDAKRSPLIYVQPSIEKFRERIDQLSNGQLKGLDWSNIFIAGGIVLGSLLCVDSAEAIHQPSMWIKSDIDIYIYGLNPIQANKKIEHLFGVFKANLPAEVHDSVIAVKNSKTITFLAPYPHRRFQIILKLVKNPTEVLLNFDLDICSMGYDGETLWMLPRAVRALETGYNTFTMDMVQGHYLGERRASQDKRVFKYANKGYGIRFLPSYVEYINVVDENSRKRNEAEGFEEENPDYLIPIEPVSKSHSINVTVSFARDYFEKAFRTYMRWTRNGRDLERHYSSTSSWYGTSANPPPTTASGKKISFEGKSGLPIFTHALLDTIDQLTSEPLRRSCLTGFEVFFRHVALWEAEQQERLWIQDDVWASTTYDDTVFGVSYDDLPQYSWDETFSSTDFLKKIERYNENQRDYIANQIDHMDNIGYYERDEMVWTRRIVAGHSISEVLSQELVIALWAPLNFLSYSDHLVRSVAKDHPDLEINKVLEIIGEEHGDYSVYQHGEDLVAVHFKLSPVMMYQQLDRRLDEMYEVLWSFMHANQYGPGEDRMRSRLLIRQLSMRSIRIKKSFKEEMQHFDDWIRREAGRVGYYGGIGEGFWTEAINGRRRWMDDDEEDNTEDSEDEWEDEDGDELDVDEDGEGGRDPGEGGAHPDEDEEMRSIHSRVSMSTSGGSHS